MTVASSMWPRLIIAVGSEIGPELRWVSVTVASLITANSSGPSST